MKKQMSFANEHNIPYVVIVGETEMQTGQLTLKDMINGEQHTYPIEKIIKLVGE